MSTDDPGGTGTPGWAAPDAPSEAPSPTAAPEPGSGRTDGHDVPALPAPLRPLTIGDIIDGAFKVLKRAPGPLLGITAAIVVPVQLVAAWMQRGALSDFQALLEDSAAFVGTTDPAGGNDVVLLIVLSLLGSVAPAFVGLAVAQLVAGWYRGASQSTGELVAAIGSVLPAAIGAFLLTRLVVGVGMIACFLPGLVAMTFFVLTMPVLIVERVGPIRAMQRSAQLVRGRFWVALAVVLLSALGSSVLENSLALIPTLVAFFLPASVGWFVLAVGGVLASLIVVPVVAAATVLLYLDSRFRLEGLDLELRAGEVFETV